MCDQTVFKRYELKYFLDERQREKLLRAMEGHMAPDRFGRSQIRNIYLDTDSFRLVRRSIEKPQYKEKLRVRAYGRPGKDTPVFVELKKKFDSVVYKRRVILPHDEAAIAAGYGSDHPGNRSVQAVLRPYPAARHAAHLRTGGLRAGRRRGFSRHAG